AHKGRVLLAGLAVGAVMFSGSRGGMLAVAAVGIVLVAGALLTRLPACGRLLKKARVWIMIGVGAAAALAAGVLPRLLTIASGDTSTAERLAAWRIALQEIARRPFFGSGAGMQNFWSILEANGLPQVPHAHNLYLQVLVTGGIVGLLLVFGLFAGVLFRQRGKTLTLALAFCAGVLVFGVVEYPFMCPKLVGAFLVALGLLACVRRVAATPADAPPAGQTAA
ncbi:MAG: O-antigen ligase family protein, partial [Oscillospiraceae bacterium]|nr:O-antigen ligase family protein [Oscillospiraceae bacterium]